MTVVVVVVVVVVIIVITIVIIIDSVSELFPVVLIVVIDRSY